MQNLVRIRTPPLTILLKMPEVSHLIYLGHSIKTTENKVSRVTCNLVSKIICVLCLSFAAACNFTMANIDGLEIGQTYREVLQKLTSQSVQHVIPVIQESIVIKYGQIDKLHKLKPSLGICLGDNRGVDISMEFNENNILTDIRTSSMSDISRFNLDAGRGKDSILEDLEMMMEENQKLMISSCIYDLRWINLNEVSDEDFEYLTRYSTIKYHYSDSYSYTTLNFENQALAQITYHWRPFEE